MSAKDVEQLNYTRRLYDNVLDWYKSADSKAQVILAIDGGFIAFVSSTVFVNPGDLKIILGAFSPITWSALAIMIISLVGSIGASIYCLWSRIYSEKEIRKFIDDEVEKASVTSNESGGYPPSVSYFFQFIEHLDLEIFGSTIRKVDSQFELKALTSQIHILSGNVRDKHFAVNMGFALTSLSLIMFFAVAGSYTLTII